MSITRSTVRSAIEMWFGEDKELSFRQLEKKYDDLMKADHNDLAKGEVRSVFRLPDFPDYEWLASFTGLEPDSTAITICIRNKDTYKDKFSMTLPNNTAEGEKIFNKDYILKNIDNLYIEN